MQKPYHIIFMNRNAKFPDTNLLNFQVGNMP